MLRLRDFTGKFYQTFREKNTSLPENLERKKREYFPTHSMPFCKASIILILKLDEDITRKLQTNTLIDSKIHNKILINQIQQHIKSTIFHD